MITSFLGQGGMANVYEVWNGQLEVYRAVKVMNPNSNRDARERFQTEMKISAKLHHPNITEIYGVGVWNGLPFIEMEKLTGITLDVVVRQRGALPPSVCTAVGIMVGRALKYAHSQEYQLYGNNYKGVIHRDLKPSNMMMCSNGAMKLMDFGIASPAEASFHTVAGTVLGTLQYLAPEQLECKKLTVSSDIYSLGVTLYEVLTGAMAFSEPGVHKLMLDKLKGRYKPLSLYKAKIPARLRRLITRCMDQDPSARIQTAEVLLSELGAIHSALTDQSPEQVMRGILETPAGEKVVVATRSVWPARIAAGLAVSLGAGALVYIATTVPIIPRAPEASVVRDTVRTFETVVRAETVMVARPEPTAPAVARARPTEPVLPAAAPSSAPAPAQSKPVSRPLTVVEQEAERYGTTDLLELVRRASRAGQHATVLALVAEMVPAQRDGTEARLLELRALRGAGKARGLAEALESREIADGEYFLMRAQLALEQGKYAEVLTSLERSSGVARVLLDYDQYKREAEFTRARCATALYDRSSSEADYKKAMDSWYQVRSLLRSEPNHEYNRVANQETQRIGQKHRAAAGGGQG